ncbi:unnamed protein product [Urochloa humidicola]
MLNLYPRHQLQLHASSVDGDENAEADVVGYNPFYTASPSSACPSSSSACSPPLSASGRRSPLPPWPRCCSASPAASRPRGGSARSSDDGRGPSAELVVVTVTADAARPGYACAQMTTPPPAFAFQCPQLEAGGGEGAAAASSVVCSVCLEDVRGGDMVRQVPACRHIFHVECIDMWLRSHRTCPMCRCVVSPPEKVTPKDVAAEVAPESSAEDELPPV